MCGGKVAEAAYYSCVLSRTLFLDCFGVNERGKLAEVAGPKVTLRCVEVESPLQTKHLDHRASFPVPLNRAIYHKRLLVCRKATMW